VHIKQFAAAARLCVGVLFDVFAGAQEPSTKREFVNCRSFSSPQVVRPNASLVFSFFVDLARFVLGIVRIANLVLGLFSVSSFLVFLPSFIFSL